jgi:hypothetical protein
MAWLQAICEDINGNAALGSLHFSLQNLLFGYHWQYVPSCVAASIQVYPLATSPEHTIVAHCKRDLMRMLRPDGTLKVMKVVATSQLLSTASSVQRGSVKTSSSHNPPSYLLAPFIEDYLASYYFGSLWEFIRKHKAASVNGVFFYTSRTQFLFIYFPQSLGS